MPSLGDSAVIILLGLLLFGPKGLAQIARQLGKLMGEFRRASNEFRMQMEEELRVAEQADRQKEIAAIEAAAPAPPLMTSSVDSSSEYTPHLHATAADTVVDAAPDTAAEAAVHPIMQSANAVPIATSGELSIMPPATGLPSPRRSSLSALIDSVPHVDAPNGHAEAAAEGPLSDGSEQRPMRYTNHADEHTTPPVDSVDSATAAESVHG